MTAKAAKPFEGQRVTLTAKQGTRIEGVYDLLEVSTQGWIKIQRVGFQPGSRNPYPVKGPIPLREILAIETAR